MQNEVENITFASNTMATPKISILMSVNNGEKYLKEAVESMLNQTYTDFEFIIINDASTDSTDLILNSFSDKRIILHKNQTNLGLTKSLNIGLKLARGEYVARMDADDISLPGRLKIQKEFLDSHKDIVAVGGEIEVIDSNNNGVGFKKSLTDPEKIRFALLMANQINHPAVMFRRKEILDSGGYNEEFLFVQDFELWSRLSKIGHRFSNIPTPLIRYRFHGESITQGKDSKEKAYFFAVQVIKQNISRYVKLSENDFKILLLSFHKHHVNSFLNMIRIRSLYSKIAKEYIINEGVGNETIQHIKSFTRDEANKTLRWYTKDNLPLAYKTFSKIYKLRGFKL